MGFFHLLIYHSKKHIATIHVGSNISSAPHWSWSMGYSSEISHGTWKSPIRKGKTSSKSSCLGSMSVFGGVLFIQVTSMHPKSCGIGLESCGIGLTFMRGFLIEGSGFLYRPRRRVKMRPGYANRICFFCWCHFCHKFVCLFFKYPLFKSWTYSDFILERISLFLVGPWWCRRPPSTLCPSHYVNRFFLPPFEVPSSKLKIVNGKSSVLIRKYISKWLSFHCHCGFSILKSLVDSDPSRMTTVAIRCRNFIRWWPFVNVWRSKLLPNVLVPRKRRQKKSEFQQQNWEQV